MAFYTFYFMDSTYTTIEHMDESNNQTAEARKAYESEFGSHITAIDFFERHEHKPDVDDLASWIEGKWQMSIHYDRVISWHPTPMKGTYKDLWNWLCGAFDKGDTYSTVPLIYFDGSETAVEASVPFGIDCGSYFEQSNPDNQFDRIWKTLPRDRGEPEYKKDCASVIGLTDQKTAIIVFPVNIQEYPDEKVIQVTCDFETNSVVFGVKD